MHEAPGTDPERTARVEKAQQKIDRMVESAGRGVKRIEDVVSLMRRYAREGYPTERVDLGRRTQLQRSRIEILSGPQAGEILEERHSMTAWTPETWTPHPLPVGARSSL